MLLSFMSRTSFRVNLHYSLPECQGTPCLKHVPYLKLSDSNGIRTHNHLVRKRTLNHLAKLAILAYQTNYILAGQTGRCCH